MVSELLIAEDQVFVINTKNAQKYSYVDVFTMEDNSRIEVRADWPFNAKNVTIGTGCLIDASGGTGPSGQHVTFVPNQTGECNRGDDNKTLPPHGTAGGRGQNLIFNWGIISISGLTIRSNGGHGGNGGNGAPGGMGGGARCHCRGGNGGTGSNGGNAGPGGDSGHIVIRWTPRGTARTALLASEDLKLFTKNTGQNFELVGDDDDFGSVARAVLGVLPQGLAVEASGGLPGSFGIGGGPSSGGAGQSCGPFGVGYVVPGGDQGARGANGAPALSGRSIPWDIGLA